MQLVFDLDGVLLDSETDLAWLDRAIDAALDELDVVPTESVRAALFPPTAERLHEAAEQCGLPAERLWTVRNRHYVQVKCDAIETGELRPFDDVEELYAFRPEHDLHIVSNSPTAVVETFVESHGLADLFEVRIGRGGRLEDLQQLKPDPHMYGRLVEGLGDRRPDVYVGDAESDRAFANATGMRFIHLTRDDRGVRSLRGLAGLLE